MATTRSLFVLNAYSSPIQEGCPCLAGDGQGSCACVGLHQPRSRPRPAQVADSGDRARRVRDRPAPLGHRGHMRVSLPFGRDGPTLPGPLSIAHPGRRDGKRHCGGRQTIRWSGTIDTVSDRWVSRSQRHNYARTMPSNEQGLDKESLCNSVTLRMGDPLIGLRPRGLRDSSSRTDGGDDEQPFLADRRADGAARSRSFRRAMASRASMTGAC